jgi:hypothetical protein
MTPPRRTYPGGIPTTTSDDQQYTPTPVLVDTSDRQTIGSRTFVAMLSTILGILVSTTVIIGFTGKYFYVDRAEYTTTSLKEADDRGKLQGSLNRLDLALVQQITILERQERKIDELSDTVRKLELKLAAMRR